MFIPKLPSIYKSLPSTKSVAYLLRESTTLTQNSPAYHWAGFRDTSFSTIAIRSQKVSQKETSETHTSILLTNLADETMSSQDAQLPLRPALVQEDVERGGPAKAVSIDPEPEKIEPLPSQDDAPRRRQHTAGLAKRLSGRPPPSSQTSSHASPATQSTIDDANQSGAIENDDHHRHKHDHHHHHEKFISQVATWLQSEKAKKAARRARRRGTAHSAAIGQSRELDDVAGRPRRGSQDSDSSEISLERLQKILEDSMTAYGHEQLLSTSPNAERRPTHGRRRTSGRSLTRTYSSDTEYVDGDAVVPSCDVVLDNSKTMSYGGGAAESDLDLVASGKRADKERKAWNVFKNEIVRLAHTLRLKGWRRVPLDRGADIEVERLSGALTNAVYVVSPPKDLPAVVAEAGSNASMSAKKPPPKLLLRIYGPQVEHLIDRENELSILRRLARKRIGPRLLGTFRNGRFEEFYNATTLTYEDLRVPATSKQIAKRMRELHDGIELLEKERDEGPFVWRNWDKWVERCEQVITWVDHQILSGEAGAPNSRSEGWKERGLICGVEWPVFKKAIDTYRAYLNDYYGGPQGIRERLVFAHNDTQYGNILRMKPAGESPLLLPANEHKQLVVIDFEYASANLPGLEFANHFTEWCYNYHDPTASHVCNTRNYPTVEEQRRFIRSYVNHRPQFNPKASATPATLPSPGPTSSISEFMLDSRAPPTGYQEEESKREKALEQQVEHLMKETKLWRVANTAQWVAWGIVQAQLPGLDSTTTDEAESNGEVTDHHTAAHLSSDRLSPDAEKMAEAAHDKRPEGYVAEALAKGEEMNHEEDDEDEFDYLAYAQERAMFFWGDILALGLVKPEELPKDLLAKVKTVEY